jgi:hypothetical protein
MSTDLSGRVGVRASTFYFLVLLVASVSLSWRWVGGAEELLAFGKTWGLCLSEMNAAPIPPL